MTFRRLALPLLLAVGGAVYIGINLSMPYRGFHQEAFVDLPKGTNARQMAEVLENAGEAIQGATAELSKAAK